MLENSDSFSYSATRTEEVKIYYAKVISVAIESVNKVGTAITAKLNSNVNKANANSALATVIANIKVLQGNLDSDVDVESSFSKIMTLPRQHRIAVSEILGPVELVLKLLERAVQFKLKTLAQFAIIIKNMRNRVKTVMNDLKEKEETLLTELGDFSLLSKATKDILLENIQSLTMPNTDGENDSI